MREKNRATLKEVLDETLMRDGAPKPGPSVEFFLEGAAPSKSNYRKGGKHWKPRWQRVKDFEADVGKAAMAAGARKHMGKGRVSVDVRARNQVADPDNLFKALLDGMKHVAFEDDSADHIAALSLSVEDGEGPPMLWVRVTWPEGGSKTGRGAEVTDAR